MLKPTRTTLALAGGSLVLGLVGAAGAAVADEGPKDQRPPREIIVGGPANGQTGGYPYDEYAIGKVVSKGPLKVRSKPTTQSRSVGRVSPNSKVEISCKENGQKVDGNRLWYRLAEKYDDGENDGRENGVARPDRGTYDKERWVSARYVRNLTHVKYCR